MNNIISDLCINLDINKSKLERLEKSHPLLFKMLIRAYIRESSIIDDLTNKERITLEFIENYISYNNKSPTLQEIANGIGITSKGVAKRYVDSLCEHGYIMTIPNISRNIRLL